MKRQYAVVPNDKLALGISVANLIATEVRENDQYWTLLMGVHVIALVWKQFATLVPGELISETLAKIDAERMQVEAGVPR